MMRLLEPLELAHRTARNRLLFGPHVTNLGWDRSLSERHVAYYERRARGGHLQVRQRPEARPHRRRRPVPPQGHALIRPVLVAGGGDGLWTPDIRRIGLLVRAQIVKPER